MSYNSWFKEHALKHASILAKLQKKYYNENAIIKYFDFDNMVKEEPGFCPLYAQNKKCHELKQLNCYLCACPNFRFNDDGFLEENDITQFSFCNIDSKDGKQRHYDNAIHQDCSRCCVPHHEDYVKKYFNHDWKSIMEACKLISLPQNYKKLL